MPRAKTVSLSAVNIYNTGNPRGTLFLNPFPPLIALVRLIALIDPESPTACAPLPPIMPQTEKNEQRERAHDGPERQDLTTESRSVATGVSEKGDQEDGPQETRKPERDNSPAGAQPDTSEAVVDNPMRSGKLQLVLVILGMLQICPFYRMLLLFPVHQPFHDYSLLTAEP